MVGTTAQVHFISEPNNQCVAEEETAYFPCTYTGTSLRPKWRINENEYTISTLPLFHFFDGMGLLVTRISISMNMSQYTCFFNSQIMSNTAILTVVGSKSSK